MSANKKSECGFHYCFWLLEAALRVTAIAAVRLSITIRA